MMYSPPSAKNFIDTSVHFGIKHDKILRKHGNVLCCRDAGIYGNFKYVPPWERTPLILLSGVIAHVLIRLPREESAHNPTQNDSSVSWCRSVRAAPGHHGGTRGRSSSSFWALAVGKRAAAPLRSRIPSFHPCTGYGLVFLSCGGMQSRQGGGVHRGLLCAKKPALPLRDEV
jgi:hypothetical protein